MKKALICLSILSLVTNTFAWTCQDDYGSQLEVTQDSFNYGNYPENNRIAVFSGPITKIFSDLNLTFGKTPIYNRDTGESTWSARVNTATNSVEIRILANPKKLFALEVGGRYLSSLRTEIKNDGLNVYSTSGHWYFPHCF